MTSAQPAFVRKSDDSPFVRRRRHGHASVGAAIVSAVSILAVGAFVALGASFTLSIADGAQAEGKGPGAGTPASADPSTSSGPSTPLLGSSSEAAELVETGLAIFPYGEVDLHDVNAAEWVFNAGTLSLELAGSQENREAWLAGTIETGVGFVQLMAGAFNLTAEQKNPIGYAFKGITGATNLVSGGLTGNKVFDGEQGVEMVRAFLGMADFKNNGIAGGMGRMGMMMGGSIWNEAMVMGSRNRLNASYALGAWTIDILPWAAAMRPGSHAAQRMGRGAGAIAKWRKVEVAKDAGKLAKETKKLDKMYRTILLADPAKVEKLQARVATARRSGGVLTGKNARTGAALFLAGATTQDLNRTNRLSMFHFDAGRQGERLVHNIKYDNHRIPVYRASDASEVISLNDRVNAALRASPEIQEMIQRNASVSPYAQQLAETLAAGR